MNERGRLQFDGRMNRPFRRETGEFGGLKSAKGGIVNFTRSVAADYAKQNVRVNSIYPGFVETPMTEPAFG